MVKRNTFDRQIFKAKAVGLHASLLIFLLFFTIEIHAQDFYTGFFSDLALGGYDAVSYFEKGEAEKGQKQFEVEYGGVKWRFHSEAHRQEFKRFPEKYLPQYGGYCAWAVSEKKSRAAGDPEYWKIVDGKLYLNYDRKVQELWLQDIPGHIERADLHWPQMQNRE